METHVFALARSKISTRFWVYEDPLSASFANMIASDVLSRSRNPSSSSECDDTNVRPYEFNRPNSFSMVCVRQHMPPAN